MGRQAKLGQKNGYWYSEAGGVPRYFGKVGVVSHGDAMKKLHLALTVPDVPEKRDLTVQDLAEDFKTWLNKSRASKTAYERGRLLESWLKMQGSRKATSVTPQHLVEYQTALLENGFQIDYVKKHVVTVRMMFRYGVKNGLLPLNFTPFANVEYLRSLSKLPTEESLLRAEEVVSLFRYADTDLGTPGCRRFSREARTGAENPWSGFEEMLRVYHATGARTHELAIAKVADFSPRARQIVLRIHKRANTLKQEQPRCIYLNDAAYTIVEARCVGRAPGLPIFTRPLNEKQRRPDEPWHTERLNSRFRIVRDLAGVRSTITIYSFRHLWISEMLMAGIDILLVAKMAGTSVSMIEKTYGHFRSQSFQDAQARLDATRSCAPSS